MGMGEAVGDWDWDGGEGGEDEEQDQEDEEEKGLELGLDGAGGLALVNARGLVEEQEDVGDMGWD